MSAATKKHPAKPQPKGLGKGLSALMSDNYSQSMTNAATSKEAPNTLPISKLHAGPYQPRRQFSDEYLHELADSIEKNGIMQPILVRASAVESGKYEIIAGERRFRAAKLAKLTTVPVIIREVEDQQALEMALIENIQRQDLNALEEAAGYARLMEEFSYTQEQLASTVGKSRSHIANLLRLLSLPDSIKKLIDSGLITGGHARTLLSAENAEAIAERIWKEGLSVRETEALVKAPGDINAAIQQQPKTPRIPSKAPSAQQAPMPQPQAKSDDVLMLEEMLSSNLGLRVSINSYGNQSGDVIISYASLANLDEILKRLGGGI